MPSSTSDILNLPYIQPAQAQKHVTHNEALRALDLLVQLVVTSRAASAPPADPTPGKRYIVGPSPTGAWAGQARDIAVFVDNAWQFVVPQPGWHAFVLDEDQMMFFDGSDWSASSGTPQTLQNLELLGVNASADATNRLSVASEASLFSHAGDDHRLKINKQAAADTASVLFQSNFTGHAEMGLTGANRFNLRVSDDGTAFTTAMEVNGFSGVPTLPQGAVLDGPVTGAGVLGTVAAAGGALMETGSNANGRYVRYADGTQICTHTMDLPKYSDARLTAIWDFPVPFKTGTDVAVTMSLGATHIVTPPAGDLSWMGARIQPSVAAEDGVSLRLYRRNGGANFEAGDVVSAHAVAIGRWD